MTASPTPTDAGAGMPGELIAKSAKNPEKHHADPAYCSGGDHSPDAGNFERALNLAARAMQRQFNAGGSEEDIEAAIWQEAELDAEWRRAKWEADMIAEFGPYTPRPDPFRLARPTTRPGGSDA